MAEIICRRVAEHEFATPQDGATHLSISVGVAVYPQDAADATALIAAADAALYRAKSAGKNVVVAAAS